MRSSSIAIAATLAALGLAAPAVAQDAPGNEFRAGVLAHSADPINFDRIQDLNFELLFAAPDIDALTWLGSPRPRIGATINTGGLESMVNAGLTWHVPVFETPIFVEGTFGGALHNGQLHGAVAPARNLGCAVTFYEALSVGLDVGEDWTVMGTFEHASHAGLCGPDNQGLTNLGLRVGFKF